jgi:hypothetical protein
VTWIVYSSSKHCMAYRTINRDVALWFNYEMSRVCSSMRCVGSMTTCGSHHGCNVGSSSAHWNGIWLWEWTSHTLIVYATKYQSAKVKIKCCCRRQFCNRLLVLAPTTVFSACFFLTVDTLRLVSARSWSAWDGGVLCRGRDRCRRNHRTWYITPIT